MPILGDFTATFVNTEVMDPVGMNEVFFNSNGNGIFDAIHAIEARPLDKANFTPNLGTTVFMPERLFQFIPFPGSGGHTHDPSPPTTTPLGSKLANDSVLTANILRSQCSLIFTGKPLVVFNKGTIQVTIAAHDDAASDPVGIFGHADFDTTVDGDYTANLHTWEANQIPVCIASHRTDKQAVAVFAEPITAPHRWRIGVTGKVAGVYDVDWLVIGIRA